MQEERKEEKSVAAPLGADAAMDAESPKPMDDDDDDLFGDREEAEHQAAADAQWGQQPQTQAAVTAQKPQ